MVFKDLWHYRRIVEGTGLQRNSTVNVVVAALAGLAFGQPASAQSSGGGDLKFPIYGDFDLPEPTFGKVEYYPSPKLIPDTNQTDTGGKQESSPASFMDINTNTVDLDTSQELKSAWELWHRSVIEKLSDRFVRIAELKFSNFSHPLSLEGVFKVNKNRQIVSIRLLKKSTNIEFNSLILLVAGSMNGSPILDFPSGSKRGYVEQPFAFKSGDLKDCEPPKNRQTKGDAKIE